MVEDATIPPASTTTIATSAKTDIRPGVVSTSLQKRAARRRTGWRGWTAVPDSPLPPTARALRTVRALLAEDDQVRLLVEACAIIGRWAVLEEVATLAELDDPLPVLDRAVDLGVLRTRRASMRLLVGFRSRLVRAAAYESMGVARQRELHIRAARVLADEGARLRQRALAAGGPDAELAAELDDWAARCASGGSWEQAGEAWLAASHSRGCR